MRYRKKPIEVEAIQYEGDFVVLGELPLRVDQIEPVGLWDPPEHARLKIWIAKSETWGVIEPGDWVIAESDGSGVYPCKQAAFAETYEEVSDVDA